MRDSNKLAPSLLGAAISKGCRLSAPLLAAGLMLGSTSVYAGAVLDPFPGSLVLGPLIGPGMSCISATGVATIPGAANQDRDMCISFGSNATAQDFMTLIVAGGSLSCNVTASVLGTCHIVWDGSNAPGASGPISINPTGLGNVGAEVGLNLCVNVIGVGGNSTITFTVHTNASSMSTGAINVNAGATGEYCTGVSGSADVDDIGAIEMVIVTSNFVNLGTDQVTSIKLVDGSFKVADPIVWQTAMELDNAGFNLYCHNPSTGSCVKLNDSLIEAVGDASSYSLPINTSGLDNCNVWLEDVSVYGDSTLRGPAGSASYYTIQNAARLVEEYCD